MTDISIDTKPKPTETTAVAVLGAVSFSHLLNDMMQSMLPAIYPILKSSLGLGFGEIGLITLAYQMTASLLQPVVGLAADRKPQPYSLAVGMGFTFAGLLLLSRANGLYMVFAAAAMIGMGSSIFHPEASRVARMASGGKHGMAQSFFQVGGNAGSALGPLAAALVVVGWGQSSLAFFALLALLSCAILWNVGLWYQHHGLGRLKAA